jgi:ComF family protein
MDAIYPRYCLGCGVEGAVLCSECDRAFVTRFVEADGRAYLCDYHDVIFSRVLHAWKFGFDEQAGELLVSAIEAHRKELRRWVKSEGFTGVIAVPAHAQRKRERGFDQAEVLAHAVSRVAGLPVVTSVCRARYTDHQSKLNKEERAIQMQDNPFVTRESLAGQKLLLVDDVVTTGATVNALKEALAHAGSTESSVFSLAYAV